MKWYQMKWAQKYWGKAEREKYQQYLKSDAWKNKRAAILKKAGYKCRRCGARATEVHHETYKRIYNEKLSDLTALCRECHQKTHTKTPKKKRIAKHRHKAPQRQKRKRKQSTEKKRHRTWK